MEKLNVILLYSLMLRIECNSDFYDFLLTYSFFLWGGVCDEPKEGLSGRLQILRILRFFAILVNFAMLVKFAVFVEPFQPQMWPIFT